MRRSVHHAAAVGAAAIALTAIPWTAFAADQGAVPAEPVVAPPPPRDVIVTEERTPNEGLITSGAMMFAIPYVASVVVAAASDRRADQNLYIPFAGPWMDLAHRGTCTEPRCDNETGSKVLLVANGVMQGVGALQMLGGFLFPTKHTVTRTVGVHVTPTAGLSSVGVAAYGAF